MTPRFSQRLQKSLSQTPSNLELTYRSEADNGYNSDGYKSEDSSDDDRTTEAFVQNFSPDARFESGKCAASCLTFVLSIQS